MPLFKRKDKTTIAELEEYYANQNKNSSGRAWFMALLSLVITVAVLAGLFFGGRWLYRLVTNDDAVRVTTTGDQQSGVPSFGDIRTENSSSSDDTATNNQDSEDNTASEGVVSDEAATTDISNSPDVAGSNTGGTGGEDTIVATTDIPNTGANELIALLPLLALVMGYFYSRTRQLNK